MIFEILLVFLIYCFLVTIGSYYVNLYVTQDQFTKQDLKNIMPYLSQLGQRIIREYSPLSFALVVCIAAFVGIAVTMVTDHWFLNSCILYLILYFTVPLMRQQAEKATVTTAAGWGDTAANLIVRYGNIAVLGFGFGNATGLMYNWDVHHSVHFLWFLVNIIVLTIFLGVAVKNLAQNR